MSLTVCGAGGGIVKIFVCSLEPDFNCQMPNSEGEATGSLPLGEGTAAITWGAESGTVAADESGTYSDTVM
jgi:hypothetical protein